jgi:hypothetical protein
MQTIFEIFRGIFSSFRVPDPNDKAINFASEDFRWKQRILWAGMIWVTISVTHVAMACGWIPEVYDGFVRRGDFMRLESEVEHIGPNVTTQLAPIEKRMNTILLYQIGDKIHEESTELCRTKDQDAADLLSKEISDQQQLYYQLAQTYYQVRACSS